MRKAAEMAIAFPAVMHQKSQTLEVAVWKSPRPKNPKYTNCPLEEKK